jgi:branched-chain amino acid transport system permease protein
MLLGFVGIALDGLAFGSLLFLISVGLSVTLGLMNVVNLAHGAFAMFGGYASVSLMTRYDVPFLATLPIAFAVLAVAGGVLERVCYRRFYGATHLEQVLFTIGVTFMSVAAATYFFGPAEQLVRLPEWLTRRVSLGGVGVGAYRLFSIALVALITLGLHLLIERTRFGAQVRAAVDDPRVAAGIGVPVERVFSVTFALGSGLAGLGGALGVDVLGLDPTFALKYLVYFLLVVVVGGAGSMSGTALGALLLGFADVAGKYYVPELGAFIIYVLMVVLLLAFPTGLLGRRA